VNGISLQFNQAINAAAAMNLHNYSLVTVPKNKKKKGKPVALKEADFNALSSLLTLITRKPLVLNPPLKLTINTAGLGLPGPNLVELLTRSGATPISVVRLVKAGGHGVHAVHAVLRTRLTHPSGHHAVPRVKTGGHAVPAVYAVLKAHVSHQLGHHGR
jgi:hypothetical protein